MCSISSLMPNCCGAFSQQSWQSREVTCPNPCILMPSRSAREQHSSQTGDRKECEPGPSHFIQTGEHGKCYSDCRMGIVTHWLADALELVQKCKIIIVGRMTKQILFVQYSNMMTLNWNVDNLASPTCWHFDLGTSYMNVTIECRTYKHAL